MSDTIKKKFLLVGNSGAISKYPADVFGISSDGKYWTLEQIQNNKVDKTSIVAVGIATKELLEAEKGDGNGKGLEFCLSINANDEVCAYDKDNAKQWVEEDVWFNPNKVGDVFQYLYNNGWDLDNMKYLPEDREIVVEDETSPDYIAIDKLVLEYKKDGKHQTDMIISCTENSECGGTWTYNSETDSWTCEDESQLTSVECPAAKYCKGLSINIGGKEKKGFLFSYFQYKAMRNNYEMIQNIFSACNKSVDEIIRIESKGGNWWTSCQYSETYSVYLYNGVFGNDYKTYSGSVLPVYDL